VRKRCFAAAVARLSIMQPVAQQRRHRG
jgi:hypothetical protein